MTPKERVLTTIAHREPDRVPTGEWEFGCEIVEPVLGSGTYRNQLATKNAFWRGERDKVIQDWKTGLVKLTEHYQWDIILAHAVIDRNTPIEVPEPIGDNRWRDSKGNIIQYSEETDYFAIIEKPIRQTPPEENPPPVVKEQIVEPTASELELVRHVVRELGKTHFIVSAPLNSHPGFGYSDATRSEVENWVAVYENPEAVAEERLRVLTSSKTRHGIETAKREGVDAIAFGQDYGCNTGPFISPEMFRLAIFPGLKAYCDLVHECGLIIIHHCCGNNLPIIDQMVEAGVDVYQSVQAEMDSSVLKKRYGGNLTFWGGVPAGLLVTGTKDDVRAAGRKALEIYKPGGGFIYSTSHSVMPQAKHENYLAMLEVLRAQGSFAR
jgi:hypothetical protein